MQGRILAEEETKGRYPDAIEETTYLRKTCLIDRCWLLYDGTNKVIFSRRLPHYDCYAPVTVPGAVNHTMVPS